MKCYKCGNFLYENDYCAECGADVSVYKHIVKKSNELYNRGLELARDHNLSGAIECLKVSLKMYKANINARNLLGLIYVECGEYALGLAQWVISKSQQTDNNMADGFLDQLQNTRQDLHLMNFAIRKYNKAISYVNQGNYDLAEIQLKKLLNENSNMVKAYQLLALILMNKKKNAEARNVLSKALRIDRGNPVTIAYMTQVESDIKEEESVLTPTALRNKRVAEKAENADHSPLSGDDVIIPKSSYREYNPATMTIIQIVIGVIIGAAIIFFIVTPAKTKALRNEYQTQISDLNAKVEQLQMSNKDDSTAETLPAGETQPAAENKEDQSFSKLVEAQICYNGDDLDGAKAALDEVNPDVLSDSQKSYYEGMLSDINNAKYSSYLNTGLEQYFAEQYQDAADNLQSAYNGGLRGADLVYYLGRAYDYIDDQGSARYYLEEFVRDYPDNENVEVANQILTAYNS